MEGDGVGGKWVEMDESGWRWVVGLAVGAVCVCVCRCSTMLLPAGCAVAVGAVCVYVCRCSTILLPAGAL